MMQHRVDEGKSHIPLNLKKKQNNDAQSIPKNP